MKVTYDSNNSGGDWWLDDRDWKALESAGWTVEWFSNPEYAASFGMSPDGRFLGALAMAAHIDVPSIDAAISIFTAATGQDPYAEGCTCCGPPHYFYAS